MRSASSKTFLRRLLAPVAALGMVVAFAHSSSADWIANYVHEHRVSFINNGMLDNYLGSKTNGNPIVLWARNHSAAQTWLHYYRDTDLAEVYYADGGYGNFVVTGHGANGLSAGAAVYVHNYQGQRNQQWYPAQYAENWHACYIDGASNGDYHCTAYLSVVSPTKCIDDPYSSNSSGTPFWVWDCNGSDAQLFQEYGY